MKRSMLISGLLLLTICGFAQVAHLEASVFDNDTVLLTWDLPEGYDSDITLSWSSMLWMDNYYGCPCGQCASDQAAQFDPDDLRSLLGWRIKDVTVILSYSDTVTSFLDKHYFIRIWKSTNNYSSFIYEKEIDYPEYSIPLTVAVDSSIFIGESEGVRIGWFLDTYTMLPWEMDNLPVAPNGKGFFYRLYHDNQNNDCQADNNWSNDWPFPTGNLNVSATLTNPNREKSGNGEVGQLTSYRIYRNGELINETPYSFVTYFKDAEFAREFDVEYCVTAVYGDEESEPVCVTATITGVHETHTNHGIVIFPNPTNGVFRIEGATAAEVEVYNTLGQLVKTIRNSNEIDMADLPEGIYLVRVVDAKNQEYTTKIIVL